MRRILHTLMLTGLAALGACEPRPHAGLGPDVRRELELGEAAAVQWQAASAEVAAPDAVVIAVGYLERLRLGMGSPFRLIEQVERDPRLPASVRLHLRWALLARTIAGDAYEIDPVAYDRLGLGSAGDWPGVGGQHRALIEGAITESRDPRSGELAVRLAYALAAAERSLPEVAPRHAARIAALLRDRELARQDAVRLLQSAAAVQSDPLGAVVHWRSERWFAVEAPPLMTRSMEAEREALEIAPKLAGALRTLALRGGDNAVPLSAAAEVKPSLLGAVAAERLLALADSFAPPPQTPVAIAARTYRTELTQQPWLTTAERARRQAFTAFGSEEQFVAGLATLDRSTPRDVAPSLAAIWAAVALRPYAQEPVWFPGMPGPSAREIEERFGLASVRFDASVPAGWRPFYRRMLLHSLQDMQRVMPALDVRGLAVRFGLPPRSEGTLALHDPKRRELVLPPGSAAGTIAHELAHDLDWQIALRRYRVRGDYASDRATRTTGDRLAVRVQAMAASAMDDTPDERTAAHARRPAEIFARNVDWFVAVSLAAQGRTSGYLSSVQDDMLTGYGTVTAPDISGRAGDALIRILDEVAPLYPETRNVFLKSYGTSRALTPYDLVRRIVETRGPAPAQSQSQPLGAPSTVFVDAALAALGQSHQAALLAIGDWVCRSPGGTTSLPLERARRQLVAEATAARARGLAMDYARQIGGDAGGRWVARQLYGAPWPLVELEPGVAVLLEEVVTRARRAGALEPVLRHRFDLHALPQECGAVLLR